MYKFFSQQKFFRNFLFRLLRKEGLPVVSRQLEDHAILFSPSGVIGRHLMVKGHWHRDQVSHAISLLAKHGFSLDNKVALDLGANIGTQTIYMHLFDIFSEIVAVEPEPNNFSLLRANIDVNRLAKRTKLVNAAVGEKAAIVPLYLNEGFSDGGNSLLRRASLNSTVNVETLPLEDILALAQVQPEMVGFCWIDTEGFDHICTKQIIELIGPEVPIFTEISINFEGKPAADAYLNFLNENYRNCYVFSGDAEPVLFDQGDASLNSDSADLLLFN